MPEVKELSEEAREWERISAHSHIKGLGLEGLKAKPVADGMVGQQKARTAAGIVVQMVKQGKFAGRAILVAGPPGTGKTAIAYGISKELGKDVPFVPIAASEIYSAEVKKTEFLTQALRKAIGVRIRELRKIYEGELKELSIEKEPHPYNPYMKVPSSATIKLATQDQTKKLKVDRAFATQLLRQKIETGDVIQIDLDAGKVVKVGKSKEAAKKEELDLTTIKALEAPSGQVLKNKEFVYTVNLHQLDVANSRAGTSMFSLLFGGKGRKEISGEIRNRVNETVKNWVEEGKGRILPGVVFIDECAMLDIDTFAFLNRAMEQELAPIIIFATNRGMTKIKGTDLKAPHSMPLDLLDRLLIINTEDYKRDEILKILKIRSKAENIRIKKDALEFLADIGEGSSLRYAAQLMIPALNISKSENSKEIKKKHIKRARELFVDVKRSIKYLKSKEKEMLK